jgi:hypothetical protein
MNETIHKETKHSIINRLFKSWRFWKPVLGTISGGMVGYLYYYFVGCKSGKCAITSNPYLITLWGALLGLVLFIDGNKKS